MALVTDKNGAIAVMRAALHTIATNLEEDPAAAVGQMASAATNALHQVQDLLKRPFVTPSAPAAPVEVPASDPTTPAGVVTSVETGPAPLASGA